MAFTYLVLGVYFIIIFGIGIYFSRRNKNITDHLLAGRNLNLIPAVLTLTATMYGGGLLTGTTQYAYLNGPMIFIYPLANILGVGLVGVLIKKMAHFSTYTTVTEYLEERYDSSFLRAACSFLSMIALIGILGGQITAVRGIFSALGLSNSLMASLLAMLIIIALASLGGVAALAVIDRFQVFLIIIGLLMITGITLSEHGGLSNVLAELNGMSASLPRDYNVFINGEKAITLAWLMLPGVLYCLIGQDLYQKLFACKNEKTASRTAWLSGILIAFLAALPVITGLIARVEFPELEAQGKSASAFAMLAIKNLPPVFVGIVLAAVLAAILSTAGSLLTAATSHLVNDFLMRFAMRNEDQNSKKLLTISRAASLVIGMIAIGLSLAIPEILTIMIYSYTLYTAGAFVPIVMGVLWKGTTRQGAVAGMVTGIVTAILGISGVKIGSIPGELFSVVLAVLVTVIISLITAKQEQTA